MGADGCDNPTPPPFTGLKKELAILPTPTPSFPVSDSNQIDVSSEFKTLFGVAAETTGRYALSDHMPVALDTLSAALQLEELFQRPQYYLRVKILSFLLTNINLGISVGFNSAGAVTPAPKPNLPNNSFRFNQARLDFAIELLNPYTLTPVYAATMSGPVTSIALDITVPVNGIPVGAFIQWNEPLRIKILDLMGKGLAQLQPVVDSELMKARVVALNDQDLIDIIFRGGLESNVVVGTRMKAIHQDFIFNGGLFTGLDIQLAPYAIVEVKTAGNGAAMAQIVTELLPHNDPDAEPRVGDLLTEIRLTPPTH
jgi:hypothetical protein